MTRKFTPGPWTAKRLDAYHSMIHDADGMAVVPRMITEPGTQSAGNAALVAAAPAMLDFIKSYAAHENNVSRVGALALIKSITGV